MASYFKYYESGVLKEQYYTLVSSLVTIIGLYIAYLCKEIYIMAIVIAILLALINTIKNKITIN